MKRLTEGKRWTIIAGEAEAGLTLDAILRKYGFTRAQIRGMKFRKNGLTVDGERARINRTLKAGETVGVQLEDADEESGQLEEAPGELTILYEDSDLIAVWKEAGLVVHPSHGHYSDTLSNRLHGYFRSRGEHVTLRSIGRLDRDTVGIVVFAKNQIAAARLWKQKEEGVFRKEYLALCCGRFAPCEETAGECQTIHSEGSVCTISAPIGPKEGDLMRMCVRPDGKRAVTHVRPAAYLKASGGTGERDGRMFEADASELFLKITRGEKTMVPECTKAEASVEKSSAEKDCFTLLRVEIETGRTHQIRVHLAWAGHPLVGDPLYGDRAKDNLTGGLSGQKPTDGKKALPLGLCAWRAQLRQPFTGEEIRLAYPTVNGHA